MLKHLHISHYALIEHLDIDLEQGYTVITGETGAGKSILLGALGLLLGARADAHVVKEGEQKCVVEAVFSTEGLNLSAFFAENDLEEDGNECIIRRELTATGKSRAFVNDSPVLLGVLKPLGARLVDIHSQHQNLLLGDEDFLLQTLDLVAANAGERDSYAKAFAAYQQASEALQQVTLQAQKDSAEQELLAFQLLQLTEFAPREGEQQELEEEQQLLAHAEEIKGSLYQAAGLLLADECDVCQRLRQCEQALQAVSAHLPLGDELAQRLESTRIELADIKDEIETQLERVEFNPQRLEYVDERLARLYELEKKHHVDSDAALVEVQQQLQHHLDAIENIDEEVARLQKALDEAHKRLLAEAAVLTDTRRKAADILSTELVQSIATLGMPNGKVQVQFSTRPEPTALGADSVSLLFSANKGVAPQNVQDIASGGEVSRLMLGLKAFTARYRQLPTIIFDEIDTGVSGTMAESMGRLMKELSKHCQVICITHLPQIAALGTSHFRVYKEEDAAGTHSHIADLSPNERVNEIANMLSGAEVSEAAINNAKSLLKIF